MDWTQQVTQSTISYGLPGKDILIYGSNNLGKGKQLFKLAHKNRDGKKGVVLPFEAKGSSAKSDINEIKIINSYPSWKNFVKDMYKGMTDLFTTEINLAKEEDKIEDLKLSLKNADEDSSKPIEKRIELAQKNIDMYKEKIANNNYKKMRESYEFMLFDGVDLLSKSCEKYVTDQKKVLELSDLDDFGAIYRRFENEFIRTFTLYMHLGFTNIFIDHDSNRKIGGTFANPITEKYPKGDKRVVQPIVDVCEIVGYLEHGGIDEDGIERPSQLFMYRTPEDFFARTKWDMKDYIPEFSLEALEDAINEAVAKEEANGATVVDYKERRTKIGLITQSLEELQSELLEAKAMIQEFDDNHKTNYLEQFYAILDANIGVDVDITDTTEEQKPHLLLATLDTNDLTSKLLKKENESKLKEDEPKTDKPETKYSVEDVLSVESKIELLQIKDDEKDELFSMFDKIIQNVIGERVLEEAEQKELNTIVKNINESELAKSLS